MKKAYKIHQFLEMITQSTHIRKINHNTKGKNCIHGMRSITPSTKNIIRERKCNFLLVMFTDSVTFIETLRHVITDR